MERCCICGKPLENPESIVRGMGDVCAAKLGLFKYKARRPKEVLDPDYQYHSIVIAGVKVGVVIDSGKGRSVTNAADDVCKEIGVEHIIYRDTIGNWDFYDINGGFKPLAMHGTPTISMDTAIDVAKVRYFNCLGGLFE